MYYPSQTGPNSATEATWGVNYRALNDLFQVTETRKGTISYEVTVQMVEIYNEQVRDLLGDGAQKKYPYPFSFFFMVMSVVLQLQSFVH